MYATVAAGHCLLFEQTIGDYDFAQPPLIHLNQLPYSILNQPDLLQLNKQYLIRKRQLIEVEITFFQEPEFPINSLTN